MKKYLVILTVVLLIISFWNCEKDDICPDGSVTTPQLVVEFYDGTVTDSIITLSTIDYFETSVNNTISKSSVSQILLPLKTDEDSVTYSLTLYGNDDNSSDDDFTDTITINYTRENIYVSRACGYKTNFTIIDVTLNSNTWITADTIAQPSITNVDEVHLKLYN